MRKRTYPRPCTQCGKVFNEDGFHIKYKESGTRFSWCIACHYKRSSKWIENNRDRYNELKRQYYRRDHEPFVPKGKNKELRRAANARYRLKNLEKIRERGRQRFKLKPEVFLAHNHTRRARVKEVGGSFTPQQWRDLCDRYGNVCLCCHKSLPLSVDHVIPISKGGHNDINNLQPLCLSCNFKKHDKIIDYRPSMKCSY